MAHETFQVGDLTAVIGDNEPYDDRRPGYNGVHRLVHRTLPDRSLFGIAGLNFEHIFDGFHDQLSLSGDREVFFEPRNHPMTLRRISDDKAELHQEPTPTYQLERLKEKPMDALSHASRRAFIKQAIAGAVATGTAASLPAATSAHTPGQAPQRSRIRLGVRFGGDWLASEDDDDLRFFKQIGVDYVDIELRLIKGYDEHGIFAKSDLEAFIDRLAAVGLRVERANALGSHCLNAHLGRPEGQHEIDNLKRIGEMLAEAEIPVFGIQACQASLHVDGGRAGWDRREGRGGYRYPNFSVEGAKAARLTPRYQVTSDQLWKGLINIYKQVMPTVEGSKTVIAMHGNDPPLYEHLGSPQILCRFADFDRLFSEVPSKHNGMTLCVGTRYESGEDVFEGIRRFGQQGKLFHVHFRNVRGTLPSLGGYSEVFVDDGDLDMARVLRALSDVNYSGVIDYDHAVQITGDEPLPKQYIAFAVGYMRGLLHSL
ncbi:MAG: mannonate dehydratase [Planctomycetes bacterium]|nr:mannonate dehydratase [Planctomycetota bacterium]